MRKTFPPYAVVLCVLILSATYVSVEYIRHTTRNEPQRPDKQVTAVEGSSVGPITAPSGALVVLSVSVPEDRSFMEFICEMPLHYKCQLFGKSKDGGERLIANEDTSFPEEVSSEMRRGVRWHIESGKTGDIGSMFARATDESGGQLTSPYTPLR